MVHLVVIHCGVPQRNVTVKRPSIPLKTTITLGQTQKKQHNVISPFLKILSYTVERFRCIGPDGDECRYKDYTYWQYDTLYVQIDLWRISILKTNSDSESSNDAHEEWIIPDGVNTITMNVNHIKYGAMQGMTTDWNLDNGCTISINNDDNSGLQLVSNAGLCNPSESTESTNTYGFLTCYMPSQPSTVVTRDVYEAGLKYTFNFQIGDHDNNGGFDNGPIYDFTYTEPDHRDIWELFDNDKILHHPFGCVERYFTRTGPEGRRARLFVTYCVIPDHDDLPAYQCN